MRVENGRKLMITIFLGRIATYRIFFILSTPVWYRAYFTWTLGYALKNKER